MTLSYSVPTSLEYFASLVQSDDHFPLLEAAASLAQDEYPELDVQQLLGDVDQLLARLKRRLPADAPSLQRLRTLNQFFFVDLGFAGNVNNYYDPENSYLNAVLRTRRGIPISLAVVWMELAQGLGLHARGIAFPGHPSAARNWRSGWNPTSAATGSWMIMRCHWACTCRLPRRETSLPACCATSRKCTAPSKTGSAWWRCRTA